MGKKHCCLLWTFVIPLISSIQLYARLINRQSTLEFNLFFLSSYESGLSYHFVFSVFGTILALVSGIADPVFKDYGIWTVNKYLEKLFALIE